MNHKSALLFCLVFFIVNGYGQKEISPNESSRDSIDVNTKSEAQDSIVGFFSIFKGKPGKAALYSLIIPGGGQVYNKRYWKAPLAVLADGAAVGVALYWTNQYNSLDQDYRDLKNGLITDINGITDELTIERGRDRRRQYRDYSWFAVGLVHLVTVIEAFVDRHLMEFDISDDLSIQAMPPDTFGNQYIGLVYQF